MIEKLNLVSLISKYHLNGVVEAVRWDVKDNVLKVNFSSPAKDLLGKIEYKNFPLEDSTVAFSKTSQLNKLIAITNGYLNLEYFKQHKLITKLIIADNQYTLDYSLTKLEYIPKDVELADDFPYTATAEIDNESIAAIVKAKQALTDTDTVVIKNSPDADGEDRLELCFGGNIQQSNKVSFYLPDVNIQTPDFNEHYDSNLLKEIMYCNKDMASGTMGLCFQEEAEHMKLEFEKDTLKSTYYIVAKEQIKENDF